MEFNAFVEELTAELRRTKGEETEITVRRVVKLNGVVKTALNIMEEDRDCSPNVYLEGVYDLFQKYSMSIEQAAVYVMEMYGRFMKDMSGGCQLEQDIEDFEKVRGRLTVRMVNRAMNSEILEDAVYVPFLDLAAIIYVADDLHSMNAIVRVTKSLAAGWGRSPEELLETALGNLRRHGHFGMRDLRDVICENGQVPEENVPKGPPYMYVLTDGSGLNGSSALLLPELLGMAASEIGDDLMLLPSAISELIVLRACGADADRLKKIVADVNDTVVDAEELLSYSVYKYSRGSNEVTVAA